MKPSKNPIVKYALIAGALLQFVPAWPQVAPQDGRNWTTYSGNYAGWRYSSRRAQRARVVTAWAASSR